MKVEKIWDHFGEDEQLKKFLEEADELVEAVKDGEYVNILDELADVALMYEQIIHVCARKFGIRSIDLKIKTAKHMGHKYSRTIERIESRYYEKVVE